MSLRTRGKGCFRRHLSDSLKPQIPSRRPEFLESSPTCESNSRAQPNESRKTVAKQKSHIHGHCVVTTVERRSKDASDIFWWTPMDWCSKSGSTAHRSKTGKPSSSC